MISTMREYFRGLKFVLLLVIVAFVATSVVYFGAGSMSGGVSDHAVATVNGEEIPVERFRRAYSSYIEFYRQGRLLLDEMVTRRGRLDDINEAFRAMKAGEVARTVLTFN